MTAVESDSLLDFALKQVTLSSSLYPQELREHISLFEQHVWDSAQKIVNEWRQLFSAIKPNKVENFIKRYILDLRESVRIISNSFFLGNIISTLDEVRKSFPPNNAVLLGITREEYYIRSTDQQSVEFDEFRLDYPHPYLIKTQKMRLCHLVALQMQHSIVILQVLASSLSDDAEDYVPLGWEATL